MTTPSYLIRAIFGSAK